MKRKRKKTIGVDRDILIRDAPANLHALIRDFIIATEYKEGRILTKPQAIIQLLETHPKIVSILKSQRYENVAG